MSSTYCRGVIINVFKDDDFKIIVEYVIGKVKKKIMFCFAKFFFFL